MAAICLGLNMLTHQVMDLYTYKYKAYNHGHHCACRWLNTYCLKPSTRAMLIMLKTRTTRTPAFWDTPATPCLPWLVIHIRSQVKKTKSKLQILKDCQRFNLEILPETLYATQLLKLLDKMYEYEMDPIRTVGTTAWTRDAGGTDGRTDRWMEWNQYTPPPPPPPPQQLHCAGGIMRYTFIFVFVFSSIIKCVFVANQMIGFKTMEDFKLFGECIKVHCSLNQQICAKGTELHCRHYVDIWKIIISKFSIMEKLEMPCNANDINLTSAHKLQFDRTL